MARPRPTPNRCARSRATYKCDPDHDGGPRAICWSWLVSRNHSPVILVEVTVESREVLARLAEEGIRIHRETLARTSDELGLSTREGTGRRIPRRWSQSQVKVLIGHLRKADLGMCGPRPLQKLSETGGPFPSRDVLAHLRSRGFSIHRETLTRISDELGLPTRDTPHGPRQWTLQQAEAIHHFLQRRQQEEEQLHRERELEQQQRRERELERRRRQECRAVEALAQSLLVDSAAELEPDDLRALLAGNPDLTRQLLDQVTGLLRQHLVPSTTEPPGEKPKSGRKEAA